MLRAPLFHFMQSTPEGENTVPSYEELAESYRCQRENSENLALMVQKLRYAPACVCNVASRVLWLREIISEFDRPTQKRLARFVAPLPFELELLSGNMERVDAAIKAIGALPVPMFPDEMEYPLVEFFAGQPCQPLGNP